MYYRNYAMNTNKPLYSFGFGLSYSDFEYGDIKLDKDSFAQGEKITASVEVKNTGSIAGDEVVQLYLRDLVGSITRPIKELRGFEKIHLEAGETKTVSFTIDEKLISFFTKSKKWEAEPGDFKVFIGGNSVDLKESKFQYN